MRSTISILKRCTLQIVLTVSLKLDHMFFPLNKKLRRFLLTGVGNDPPHLMNCLNSSASFMIGTQYVSPDCTDKLNVSIFEMLRC